MCAELDHESLDFLIMGQLMSNTSISSKTHHHIQPPDERQRVSTAYYHQGIKVCYYNDTNMKYTHVHNILVYISIPFIKVCKKTFTFLHGIGKSRLNAIRSSLLKNGIEAR